VIEADSTRVTPLAEWTGTAATAASGQLIPRAELNGSVGGSIAWTTAFDATLNRFAFHDALEGVDTIEGGVVGDLASYLVAGWWSTTELDPLDGAQTTSTLQTALAALRWSLKDDQEGGYTLVQGRTVDAIRRESMTLDTATRYATPRSVDASNQRAGRAELSAAQSLDQATTAAKAFVPASSVFADEVGAIVAAEPSWPRSTMVHGTVHGVPVTGPVVADIRPDPEALDVVLGHHDDDLAAALAARGLGVSDPAERRALERVLSAFTGKLLDRLGSADGTVDVDEHEHAAGFEAIQAGDGGLDRVRVGATGGAVLAGRPARSQQAGVVPGATTALDTSLSFLGRRRSSLIDPAAQRTAVLGWDGPPGTATAQTEVREVTRPAPRYFRPLDPLVGIRGPVRSLRHLGDGRVSADGTLVCRWPSQVPTGYEQVIDGSELIPTLGNGAVPPETLRLVHEALTQSPYFTPWLADVAAARRAQPIGPIRDRLFAETAIRHAPSAISPSRSGATLAGQRAGGPNEALIGDQLLRFSIVKGVELSVVGRTEWTQPWIPLWLEWEIELDLGDRTEGWTLGTVDTEPPPAPRARAARRLTGRSPLHTGTATTLAAAINDWAIAEDALDHDNVGEADEDEEALLDELADAVDRLDIVSASLDGVRNHMLGLPTRDGRLTPKVAGALVPLAPVDDGQLLAEGDVRLVRARLVDAFGRTLDLPAHRAQVPVRDEVVVDGQVALRVRPRIVRPTRWLFRLVDPADLSAGSPEATVDEIDPARMVNPVAGFLLPDHIDEALEVFGVDGAPLGQLMHEPFGGGVVWEIAPGRDGPADAGPGHGLTGGQQILGHFAASMVASDAKARRGRPLPSPRDAPASGSGDPPDEEGAFRESALSAFLRAVDTTLWTVDTYATLGNEHIAGLVGRPIAVVRATLRLDLDDDLEELDLSDPELRASREAMYAEFANRAFPVRLGEITRSDDGLLAFFVDDDYETAHLVDKVARDAALESGRRQGHFGRLGQTPLIPERRPVSHPYVAVADDELLVHPGQVVRLTLLMHPTGRVHLTSGVLPRKSLALQRAWIQPGLAVIAPSARIGPVLIDAGQVRLPTISAFPGEQIWTRRDTPSTWKDDPILAATQTALLPDIPSQLEEGYIRIAPVQPGATP